MAIINLILETIGIIVDVIVPVFVVPTMNGTHVAEMETIESVECSPLSTQNVSLSSIPTDLKSVKIVKKSENEFLIHVLGNGLPSSNSKGLAQRRHTALRAAQLDAQRNLEEWHQSNFQSNTHVNEGVLTEDWIISNVSKSSLKTARIYEDFDAKAGIGTVVLATICLNKSWKSELQ